ncbi:MAG: PAS domain-containing protein, partial [Candidatus Zixiibacteriota bacterium]
MPPTYRPWRAYLMVGMVALLVAGTLWYTLRTGNHIAKVYSPLIHGAMEIRLELTTSHLWFEEMLAGDRQEDISKIWSHLDTSIWYARAMLHGGQNVEDIFIGTDDSLLAQKLEKIIIRIEQFRLLAEERRGSLTSAIAGTDIDRRFDSVFASIIEDVIEVERGFQRSMAEDLHRFHKVLTGLILACFCLAFLVALILHRFEKRKARDLYALLVSEQKFRTYVDNALNIVCMVDAEGRFLEVNEATCQSTGYSETELLSMSCLDLVPPDNLDRVKARLGILMRKGRLHFEELCRRKDGTDLFLSLDAVRIADNRYLLCCADVTERRRSEEALKESEEKHRLIAERAFDVIIITESDGIITYASPSIERVFGYEVCDVVGRYYTNLTPDKNVPWIAKAFELTASGKIAENHMSQLLRADGSIADVEINAVPIKTG